MAYTRHYKRVLIAFGLALGLLAGAQAQNLAGTMDYFEGQVELVRESEVLDASIMSFGESVYSGESVRTGANGRAELSLRRSAGATVTVQGNTAYTLPEPAAGEEPKTAVRLLFGKVALAVDRAAGGEPVEVRSGTAVFGVRGTELDVMTSPDGALLMGVREGQVSTRADRGTTVAAAGQAVEVLPSGSLSTIDVPEGRMSDFFQAWHNLRTEAFRRDPVFFTQNYLNRYREERTRFRDAASDLMSEADTIRRMGADDTGRAQRMQLRGAVAPKVVAARSALALYEESFFALADLLNLLGPADLSGLSESHRAATREFRANQPAALQQLTQVRRLLRLYDSFELSVPSFR